MTIWNFPESDKPFWVYRKLRKLRSRSRENLKIGRQPKFKKARNVFDPRSKPEPYTTGNQPKYLDQMIGQNTWTYSDWRGNSSTGTANVRRVESLLISRGNPKKRGYYRSGGDFYVEKVTQGGSPYIPTVTGFKAPSDGGGWRFTQTGALVDGEVVKQIFPTPTTIEQAKSRLNSLATQYEATGRARIDPFRPVVNLGQNLVESIRGAPSMVGSGVLDWYSKINSHPQAVARAIRTLPGLLAKEYLNLQFGVLPTAKDLLDGIALVKDIEDIKARLRKEAGKRLRRRRTLKDSTTVTIMEDGSVVAPFGSGHGETLSGAGIKTSQTRRVRFKINREKVWYVARFTYYLGPPSLYNDLKLHAQLAGLVPNLSNAWSVSPWSWLAGWFSNINDIMRNISSNIENNIVLEYSYVMRTTEERVFTTYTHKLEWEPPSPTNPSGNDVSARTNWEVHYVTKERAGGRNPFGFYVGIDELDAFQNSILVALGISRSRVISR